MEIHRSGSRPSQTGSAEYFTGRVRIDPILSPPDPARSRVPTSPSSRARARPGTLIPSDRP